MRVICIKYSKHEQNDRNEIKTKKQKANDEIINDGMKLAKQWID